MNASTLAEMIVIVQNPSHSHTSMHELLAKIEGTTCQLISESTRINGIEHRNRTDHAMNECPTRRL